MARTWGLDCRCRILMTVSAEAEDRSGPTRAQHNKRLSFMGRLGVKRWSVRGRRKGGSSVPGLKTQRVQKRRVLPMPKPLTNGGRTSSHKTSKAGTSVHQPHGTAHERRQT